MEQPLVGNRGQGSLEYLTNYGWAFLIIIAAGAALWQMGYLGSTVSTELRAEGGGNLKFIPGQSSIHADPGLEAPLLCSYTLTFANGGSKIIITDVNFSHEGFPCNDSVLDIATTPNMEQMTSYIDENILESGESFTFYLSGYPWLCPQNPEPPRCSTGAPDYPEYTPPYSYRVPVTFTYVNFGSELEHKATVTIHGGFD